MNWGVLGAGFFVNRRMAAALRGDLQERIVAVHNRRLERAREFAERFSTPGLACRAYDDPCALASDEQVDAVYIATPNHLHVEGVEAAIQAGKPILCEKPLAGTLSDGEEIARIVRDSGIPFLAGFVMRHNPVYRKARELIQTGYLGQISHGRFQMCKTHPVTERSWRHWPDAQLGGGVILDLASHACDLFSWLFDDRIESVSCEARDDLMAGSATDQTALLTLRFSSGPLVSIEISFATVPPQNPVEINGNLACLHIAAPGGGNPVMTAFGETGTEEITYEPGNPFLEQARYASHVFKEGITAEPGIEAALANLRILHAAHKSWHSGRRIDTPSDG